MSESEKEGWREAVKALRDLVASLEHQLEEAKGVWTCVVTLHQGGLEPWGSLTRTRFWHFIPM